MEVILVGQHTGKKWRKMPIEIPAPYHYLTITHSTKWAFICWLVHQSFNSCTERLSDAHNSRDNVMCISDKRPTRSFFGFLLTSGKECSLSLSAALYWLSAAHLQLQYIKKKLLLHCSLWAKDFKDDSLLTTPQLVMTYKVSQLMKNTCRDVTDWGLPEAHNTLECRTHI